MKARHGFASFLGPDIERFIAHKRSAGRRYHTEEKSLRLLDDFLLERRVLIFAKVTPALIDEFLASRPRSRPRSYNHLRCTIGRLFAYLVSHGKLPRTPLQSPSRRSRYQRSPFIFDQTAARRLLAIARSFTDRGGTIDRGNTYYASGKSVDYVSRMSISSAACSLFARRSSTRADWYRSVRSSRSSFVSTSPAARRDCTAVPIQRSHCFACCAGER